ncbi:MULTISPECIES: tRNA (adenine-N1)-methyltransferase [Methanothermobacter]|uniref:Predicted methyltransferase n=1 Tax=Methanothermobacter marburgensis (strain ATCC BAA-927 / DSM 2133 / JCM 14651 / NBRC 100331 / OCM 82 / Marburg) TaxID=79929 RepID=D9PYS0_METTM|nr:MULTISPECIES: tRNA (adenine-N1)-methyltransferase [Methanothermobacter]ADL57615.1 predicted methyltransferase [Methanothermobacter marburgensis str. Marburg]QEF94481.1 tRNA (adenine-N1)-methyltransferase [Methanothermobacter sp. KEPCO-1]QHN07629.1 tRNA (adenine-N1)-methyltransferase [Methanothermobacter sp. THM-2]
MRIIMDERGKKYLLKAGEDFQTDMGIIQSRMIEEARPGDVLRTHLGREVYVLKPSLSDYLELMERRCSILLPKDIGMICAYTGIVNGSRVVDAGTGAGTVAMYLANVVGESGHVTTYEIRQDFAEVAERNIRDFGFKNIEVKNRDIKEGIDEDDLDLVFLDLPQPWELMEDLHESLIRGGWAVFYNPYIEQVKILHRVGSKLGFADMRTSEIIEREIEVRRQGTRPRTRMVGHTGYLTFMRKV